MSLNNTTIISTDSQPPPGVVTPSVAPLSTSKPLDLTSDPGSATGSTARSTPATSLPETPSTPMTLANMATIAQSLFSSGNGDSFALIKQFLDTNGADQATVASLGSLASGLSSASSPLSGLLGGGLNLSALLNDTNGPISEFLSLNSNLAHTINVARSTESPGNDLPDFNALYDQAIKNNNNKNDDNNNNNSPPILASTPDTISSSSSSSLYIKTEEDLDSCATSVSGEYTKQEPTISFTAAVNSNTITIPTTKSNSKKTTTIPSRGKSTTSSSNTQANTADSRVTKTKRKPHHKSRRGCQTCKKRRVKCDETHPLCKNCEHLGLECGYEIAAREEALIKANLENTAPPLEGGSLSMVDLTLFHYYMTETWHTISGAGIGDQPMWRDYMPKLALKHPFLMHALMAFSAAHRITSLSSIDGGVVLMEESQKLETNKAMNFHRLQSTSMLKELVESRPTDIQSRADLVDAIVGSTLLLIFESLANTKNHGASQSWINQVRGSATILSAVWPLIPTSRFYSLIGADIRELSSPENQLALITKLMSNGGNIPIFDPSIADLYPVDPMSVYFPTLIYLDKLMSQQHYPDFILRMFSFPALMDKKMGELLCASDPTAKRILAAYGKFIIKHAITMKDKVWFLEGLASGGVSSGDMEAFGSLGLVSLDLPQIDILDEMMPDYDFQTFDVMEYLI